MHTCIHHYIRLNTSTYTRLVAVLQSITGILCQDNASQTQGIKAYRVSSHQQILKTQFVYELRISGHGTTSKSNDMQL